MTLPNLRDLVRSQTRALVAFCLILSLLFAPACLFADADGDFNVLLTFYKKKRFDLAENGCREFLKTHVDDQRSPLVKLYLGQSLVYQQSFKDAREIFRQFILDHADNKDLALAMYRLGESSYMLGDFASAKTELRAFLDKFPTNELAEWGWEYLGECYLKDPNQPDLVAAVQAFEAVLSKFPSGKLVEDAQFNLARAQELSGQRDQAFTQYRQIAANLQGRKAADAQFNIATMFHEAKQYAKAAVEFAAIPERFPTSPLASDGELHAGFSYYELKQWSDAEARFTKAAVDPRLSNTATYWLALTNKAQSKLEPARDQFKGLYEKAKDEPIAERVLYHWGHTEVLLKNYEEGIRLFSELGTRFPEGELADDALYSSIEARLQAGQHAQGLEVAQQFAQKFPQSSLTLSATMITGRIHLAQGDQETDPARAEQAFRQAVPAFNQVLSASTKPATQLLARIQLGRAYERLQDSAQVVAVLSPVVEDLAAPSAPVGFAEALKVLGKHLAITKQFDQAISVYNKYLQVDPSSQAAAEAWAGLVQAQVSKGDLPGATLSLDRLATTDKEGTILAETALAAGDAAYAAGDPLGSLALFDRVVAVGPATAQYVAALTGVAHSHFDLARKQDASIDNPDVSVPPSPKAVEHYTKSAEACQKILAVADAAATVRVRAAFTRGVSQERLALAAAVEKQPALLSAAALQLSADYQQFHPPGTGVLAGEELKVSLDSFRCIREAARIYGLAKQKDEADQAWQLALTERERQPGDDEPSRASILHEWSLMHYNAENFARADELFARVMKDYPDSPQATEALFLLAQSDYVANRTEAAREKFRAVLTRQPDDFTKRISSRFLLDIAVAAESWDETELAAQNLQQTAAGTEYFWYAKYRYGEALLQRQREVEAAEVLSQLYSQRGQPISPEIPEKVFALDWFPEVPRLLAEAYRESKQYNELQQLLLQAQNSNLASLPQIEEVYGRALIKQAKFKEGREILKKVVDHPKTKGTKTAANAQFFIADSFLMEKKYDDAYQAFTYLDINLPLPEYQAPARLKAAECEIRQGRWTSAKESLDELIKDFPESEYAKQAPELLDQVLKNIK